MLKSLLAKTKAKKKKSETTGTTASILFLNKIQTHMVKLKENAIY